MGRRWIRSGGRRHSVARRITAADRHFLAGRYGKAEPRLAQVVAELAAIHAEEPDDAEAVFLLAPTAYLLGVARHRLGRNEEAVAPLQLSIDLMAPLYAGQPSVWGRQLASSTLSAANVARDLERWPEALALSRRALELWSEVAGERWASQRAFAGSLFAHVRAKAGVELDEALRQVDEAVVANAALLAAEPGPKYQLQLDAVHHVRSMVVEAMRR